MSFVGWLDRTQNLVVLKSKRLTYSGNFFFTDGDSSLTNLQSLIKSLDIGKIINFFT